MADMKLAFNTWVYSSFPIWVPAYPLEETIKRLARIGYDGIEIGAGAPHAYPAHLTPERRREVRELLDEHGLALSDIAFASRLRAEPPLRAATEAWFEAEPERPADVPAADWLRWEQDKHERLLAAAARHTAQEIA